MLNEDKIKTKLIELGLKPHHCGFDQVVDLIIIFSETNLKQLTQAYKEIGKKYGVTDNAVKANVKRSLKERKDTSISPKEFFTTFKYKYK